MKPRIEKKLSKRIVELLPHLFKEAWLCKDTKTWHVGGGVNYWGEGEDYFTVWEDFRGNFFYHLSFDDYPEGHRFEFMPNIKGFKPTTIRLFKKMREDYEY